jgi:hypothetical protein
VGRAPRFGWRWAVGVACASALTACKPEIDIVLQSSALPAPEFRLSMRGEPKARFVEGRVVEAGEDPRTAPVLWSFRAEVFGVHAGAERLVYGEPPDGFESTAGPKPLEPGVRYRLILAGKGWGQLEFSPGS